MSEDYNVSFEPCPDGICVAVIFEKGKGFVLAPIHSRFEANKLTLYYTALDVYHFTGRKVELEPDLLVIVDRDGVSHKLEDNWDFAVNMLRHFNIMRYTCRGLRFNGYELECKERVYDSDWGKWK